VAPRTAACEDPFDLVLEPRYHAIPNTRIAPRFRARSTFVAKIEALEP